MGPLEVLMQKAVFRPYVSQGLTDERGWKKLLGSWPQFPAPRINTDTVSWTLVMETRFVRGLSV